MLGCARQGMKIYDNRYNQRTTLGAYLDPIADKLLLASALISMAILKIVPSWVAVIVISRDVLIIMGIAIFTITEKPYRVKPSVISKITTVAQIQPSLGVRLILRDKLPDKYGYNYFLVD